MSYDLSLYQLAPGESVQDRIRAEEYRELGHPDPAAEKLKSEIAAAITTNWPWMKPFVFDYPEVARALKTSEDEARRRFRHIELNDEREPSRGIQLSIFEGSISITVPYWHEKPEAEQVFGDIGSICSLLERRWGFVVFDRQLDETVTASALAGQALPGYLRVVEQMAGLANSPAKPRRPWWKFW